MKAFLTGIRDFFAHLLTDAKGRAEPKLVIAYGFIWFALNQTTAEMFLASAGIAIMLLFGVSIFDHKLDMAAIPVEPEAVAKPVGFQTANDM